MGWFRKNAGDRPRLSPADGDEELEQLLAGDVDLAAYVDLVQSRAHVEKRAVAVHALALSQQLQEAVSGAGASEDPQVRLLAAVHLHNMAWAARGRGVVAVTSEQQAGDFLSLMTEAEERLDLLSLDLPGDEVPLWYLVSCARALGHGAEVALQRLDRLREVAPTHRRGHSHALRALSPKWGGTEEHTQQFAWSLSESSMAGATLHGLVPEALVEVWISRLGAAGPPDPEGAAQLWRDAATAHRLGIAWAAFTGGQDADAPWRVRDLNTFLFAFGQLGEDDLVRQALDLLDGRVSEYPWRYLPEDDVTISYAAVAAELRRR